MEKEQGQEFADRYKMKFMEVSAKSGKNVPEIFKIIVTEIKDRVVKTTGSTTVDTGHFTKGN